MYIDSKKLEELSDKGLIEEIKVTCKFKSTEFYECMMKDVYINENITRYNICHNTNIGFWDYMQMCKNAAAYTIRNSRTKYHTYSTPPEDDVYEFTFYFIKEDNKNIK